MTWKLSSGVHIGHSHHRAYQNCQDAVSMSSWSHQQKYWAGIVCDGCGGTHLDLKQYGLIGRSEVGANLLSFRLLQELIFKTKQLEHLGCSLDKIFKEISYSAFHLIMRSIDCMRNEDSILNLQQFWLSTILGFIMTDKEGYIFSCGDGVYQIDEQIQVIDQHGTPDYIAYKCFPSEKVKDVNLQIVSFDPVNVNRIMVATDGFVDHAKFDKDALFDQQWEKTGQYGLKKWMNSHFDKGYFNDDCAIVLAEKVCDE